MIIFSCYCTCCISTCCLGRITRPRCSTATSCTTYCCFGMVSAPCRRCCWCMAKCWMCYSIRISTIANIRSVTIRCTCCGQTSTNNNLHIMIGFTFCSYSASGTLFVTCLCATIYNWTLMIRSIYIANCESCGVIAISTLTRFIVCHFIYTVCSRCKILVINYILIVCMCRTYSCTTAVIFGMNVLCTTVYHLTNMVVWININIYGSIGVCAITCITRCSHCNTCCRNLGGFGVTVNSTNSSTTARILAMNFFGATINFHTNMIICIITIYGKGCCTFKATTCTRSVIYSFIDTRCC